MTPQLATKYLEEAKLKKAWRGTHLSPAKNFRDYELLMDIAALSAYIESPQSDPAARRARQLEIYEHEVAALAPIGKPPAMVPHDHEHHGFTTSGALGMP
jgi:hypothetical protein